MAAEGRGGRGGGAGGGVVVGGKEGGGGLSMYWAVVFAVLAFLLGHFFEF
jgi:hypothetical protein